MYIEEIMQQKYYVYSLKDPKSRLPFYIGKGCGTRAFKHQKLYSCDDSRNDRKTKTIQRIQDAGSQVQVEFIKEQLEEHEALALEASLISKYGREGIDCNGILTNISLGGNQPPNNIGKTRSVETRRKISETRKRKGLKPSEHCHRAAIKANRNKEPWNKGNCQFISTHERQRRQQIRTYNIALFNAGRFEELLSQQLTQRTRRRWEHKIMNKVDTHQ